MEKTDLVKLYKDYYTAKSNPQVLELPPAQYLSITGIGDPSDAAFIENIQALYTTAYAVKFFYKAGGKDFTVSKLEGLWHFDLKKYEGISMDEAPLKIPRSEWSYRLLIRMPDYVLQSAVEGMLGEIADRKENPLVKKVEWFTLHEGKCAQVLHTGPFSEEPKTLQKLSAFMQEKGLQHNGLHHEIYLSDFRRTAPEKLKTILREPVK
ncbi:hypothetical protein HHL16_08000 [Pseudoflavitalea sp. G-6-1-2]|uniref:GyrI-like domain-containing protein n=1 Tax=Pseudoflavitalea sp. G-6-1-2 TaxID=2728841 RepID=UPI00146E4DBF|nr:GyrI-like domain-containing protein [Pseudoflavitalea sp. G-6-1-2]NML20812.1 hypothetical protein [Pseudoflavitalea sp. G-6-1-2]